jgi:hypothetical protein
LSHHFQQTPIYKFEVEFMLPRCIPGDISMQNSNSLNLPHVNASTASAGTGAVSRVDLLTHLHTRSDGAFVRGQVILSVSRSTPRPPCLRQSRLLIHVYTSKVCRRCQLIHAFFNSIFLPCPARLPPLQGLPPGRPAPQQPALLHASSAPTIAASLALPLARTCQ